MSSPGTLKSYWKTATVSFQNTTSQGYSYRTLKELPASLGEEVLLAAIVWDPPAGLLDRAERVDVEPADFAEGGFVESLEGRKVDDALCPSTGGSLCVVGNPRCLDRGPGWGRFVVAEGYSRTGRRRRCCRAGCWQRSPRGLRVEKRRYRQHDAGGVLDMPRVPVAAAARPRAGKRGGRGGGKRRGEEGGEIRRRLEGRGHGL